MYFSYQRLPYEKEYQMLFIDNELSKVFQSFNYSDFFIESLKDISC
jgi:hypothetical protein